MNKMNTPKLLYTARRIPILRYCLILLPITILFIGTEYLYLHYQKAQLLRDNIDNVISARENSALIDSCIIKLYSADNNSRLYTVTGNKSYLQKSVYDNNTVLGVINKVKFNRQNAADVDPGKLKNLIKEKISRTNKYIKLRLLSDSLINASTVINRSLNHIQQQIANPIIKVEHKVTVDTIKSQVALKPKKKILGIFPVLSAKNKAKPVEKAIIVQKDAVTYSRVLDNKAITSNKNKYQNYAKTLNSVNDRLRTNEEQILLLNNDMTGQIIASLKNYKSVEDLYVRKSRNDLKENLANVFWEFKKVSTVNFVFLLVLLMIVFYNIWKIFRNEQLLLDYSKKAEEYAQLKGNFLAGMSHEIRTPLNSVIGFSEQLSQENLPPWQKEQVAAIKNSSEMILDLVNEILDFSKYETGKMNFENAPFMVSQVIEEITTTMNIHALKKNITLVNVNTIDEDLCCEGDKMRLKQVLINLLGNAIKFTVKGSVTLHTSVEKLSADNVKLKVKVIDTGLGIDKNDLPYIFDEFSQVAKAQRVTKHKGTGLGLAICKKIVELQGGKISVTSTVRQGSTFSFELPLKQLESMDCIVTSSIDDELMADLVKDRYILLAEDNKLNVLLATTILKKWNIKYDVAYNGLEALQLFEKNSYDMILTDIEMPEMNGLQLTQHIRAIADPVKSNVIIMALTANVMKEDRDIYFNTGVNDVVVKPFKEKALIEKIALAIQNNLSALRFII
jgi:signal transduction histidine kinase/ActR/RegA family two-component response regulator/CHASE3 domain sensor protein